MAPVTTTKAGQIDLCPKKPNGKLLKLGDTNVKISIMLTTKKAPAPIVMTRLWDKAVVPTMKNYQQVVQVEVNKLAAMVDMLAQKNDAARAQEAAKTVSHNVLNACKALQGAVDKAVHAQLAADARADQNLKESQVKVGIGIGFKVITVLVDAARIGATLGADAHADVMIFKHIGDLGLTIYDQMKEEPKLRKEMEKAYDAYLDSRKKKKEAETSTLAAVQRRLTQAANLWTSNASVAETARKRYRDEVTSMRQNLEKLSKGTEKAEQALGGSGTNLKDADKARFKVARLKIKVDLVYEAVTRCEQRADAMAAQLAQAFEEHGSNTSVDDRTFGERFGDVQTSKDLLENAAELFSLTREIADLATAAV
jgi:hypothetical protein